MVPLVAALGGCVGGALNLTVKMPPPGGVEKGSDGTETWKQGVVVDAKDGSAVCERLRVYITPMATAPSEVGSVPSGKAQYTGRGIGTYDPVKQECTVAAFNITPRDDYWVVVDYPVKSPDNAEVSYYFTGKPTLTPPHVTGGLHPVKIVDKQTTSSSLSLVRQDQQLPTPGN